MEAPPEKKQKTTDDKDEKDEEMAEGQAPIEAQKEAEAEPPKVPEQAKELEEDAPSDKSPKIKDKVTFLLPDTTMNVLPSTASNLLTCLSEGGLQQLAACARANVGIKSGRYMFEAKIVDQLPSPDGRRQPGTRSFRIGFAAEGSLFLGEEENSICFDLDGYLIHKGKGKKASWPFYAQSIVAVVLNLDSSSPNHNTVSLFRDGKRVSEPQPLPDALKGQVLFPAISFKSSTVHVNFGPAASPLPFTCRTVEEASTKDATVNKWEAPADGKHTALFPVCLPDEGTFDWLDSFLEKNPDYVEFSDRAFAQWGVKSGIGREYAPKSNDKPGISFRMDAVRETLLQVLSMHPRNLVFMEVKGNLIKETREAALAKFETSGFKIVADVLIGDPPSSFKKIVHAKVLQAKQAAANAETKAKFIEKRKEWLVRKREKDRIKREKQLEKDKLKRQKEVAEARKKWETENKKKVKEAAAKKAAEEGKPVEEEAAEKEKEEEKKEEEPEEKKEEEPEEKKEEEPEEMETEELDEPEPVEDEPPKVELVAEDKAMRFFKHPVPDLTPYEMSTSMAKFGLPEAQEGFTTVKYSWSKDKAAADYVKSWLLEKKLTTRVEDIKPSQWFKDQNSKWIKDLHDWKISLNEYKAIVSKKEAEAQRKKVAEKKAQVEAEKKAKEEAEKAKAAAEKKEEGKEEEKKEEEKKEEEKKEEEKPAAMEVEDEADPAAEVDFEGIDIFGLDNVGDLGGKMPLLREFQFEDFALMSLRVELHLLAHSFVKDVNDEDRTGVHLDHLGFYYSRYFGKMLDLHAFGVRTVEELIALVNDTIYTSEKTKVIKSAVPADVESYAVFVKLTENARRHRALMLDLGEESAKLKIVQTHDDRRRDHRNGGDNRDKGKGGGEQKRPWGPGSFGKGMYSSMARGARVAGKDKEGKGEKRAWNQDGKAYGKSEVQGAVGKREESKGYGKQEDSKGYGKRDDGKSFGKREEVKGYGKRDDFAKRDDGKGFGKRDNYARRDDSKGYGKRDDAKGYSGYGKREESKGGKGDWRAAGGKGPKGHSWNTTYSGPP